MAAGVLPKPGTDYGPCVSSCVHIDCKATREDAGSTCRFCLNDIGYDRRFFREGNGLVHASCLEDDIESKRG